MRVAALLGHAAAFHHDDAIGMLNGGEAVRDDEGGAALHQSLQGVLHQALGLRVEGGRGFVEQQNRRVLVKRACDRQTLALPAGQLRRVVAEHGVDAEAQGIDVRLQVGRDDAALHLVAIDHVARRVAQCHVGGQGVVEHDHVLAHHRELRTQARELPLADLVVVEQHLARAGQHEARQQIDQRGLARA